MSKTPRTDEHLRMKEENGHAVIVSRDFVRQLETELADKEKQLSEKDAQIVALEKKLQVYTEKRFSAPSAVCRTFHVQMCHCCDRLDCCDNISPAKQRITELETELVDKEKQLAEAQELIKKLRRCANCKHEIEYVRFGEVATDCTLDVNEEENQTCKNFDKWELE